MSYINEWWSWNEPQLSLTEIKEANEHINNHYFGKEDRQQGAQDYKGNFLKNIEPKELYLKDLTEPVFNVVQQSVKTCHTEFGYVTFPTNIFDVLLYNVYSSKIKGHYGAHIDASRSDMYDVKMTLLINLSETDYEGGDLIINNKVTDFRRPGSVIMFNSYLLHEVTPVTKGERISLAYFIQGPKFK